VQTPCPGAWCRRFCSAEGLFGTAATLQMVCVTMVYGPIAAFLVELFPTSIRYTSMSLPYHRETKHDRIDA